MALFSWRSFVWSTVAALSILTGLSEQTQAGCCFHLFSRGCCGGGYGAGYAGGYGAGYAGSYYSGYAPMYGGYGYSGYTPYYGSYASGYGGYASGYGGYAPAYGGYAPDYGGSYALPGTGCSNCAGSGCGTSTPSTNPTRPVPDDGFRKAPGDLPPDNTPTERPPRRRRSTYDPDENPPAPGNTNLPNTRTRDEGFGPSSTRSGTSTESGSATEGGTGTFRTPKSKTKTGGSAVDPFDRDTNKIPMPPAEPKKKSIDPDSFEEVEEETPTKTKANRPDLGEPSDPGNSTPPADAGKAKETVIPQKKPAPVEIPAEEPTETEDPAPMPEMPDDLKLDDEPISAGVSPKTRLTLKGQFGTPSLVRLKIRPNAGWTATPLPPVIAKH